VPRGAFGAATPVVCSGRSGPTRLCRNRKAQSRRRPRGGVDSGQDQGGRAGGPPRPTRLCPRGRNVTRAQTAIMMLFTGLPPRCSEGGPGRRDGTHRGSSLATGIRAPSGSAARRVTHGTRRRALLAIPATPDIEQRGASAPCRAKRQLRVVRKNTGPLMSPEVRSTLIRQPHRGDSRRPPADIRWSSRPDQPRRRHQADERGEPDAAVRNPFISPDIPGQPRRSSHHPDDRLWGQPSAGRCAGTDAGRGTAPMAGHRTPCADVRTCLALRPAPAGVARRDAS